MGKKGKDKKEKTDKKAGKRRRPTDAGGSVSAAVPPRLIERTLCKWTDAEIEQHLAVLAELVSEPRYVCRKCARSARRKKHLCKPMPLP